MKGRVRSPTTNPEGLSETHLPPVEIEGSALTSCFSDDQSKQAGLRRTRNQAKMPKNLERLS